MAILAKSGEPAFDLSCVIQALSTANEHLPARCRPYCVELLTAAGGTLETSGGLLLRSKAIHDASDEIDTLVICGNYTRSLDPRVILWVDQIATRANRVCSSFGGIFTLAEAGLLRGRKIAAHWTQSIEILRRYPTALLMPDAIVVRDSKLWTCSGGTGSIDLAMALIENDYGREVSRQVAMDLVVFSPRSGGQLQFSKVPVWSQKSNARFTTLVRWMNENLSQSLTVDDLAEQLNIGSRHFSRLFTDACGRSPASFVEALRVERARELLEEGCKKALVATRCGFTTEERMFDAFLRQLHVSPTEYQHNFSTQPLFNAYG
ncbi:GlxA family transcriptional regulator [Nevskia soli]|uniref:GlxA family transcriptional regulator n=1 Tax=Nevskia soli TaxID=418856 RepID=UPI0006903FD2|nr:helix-turn-helix domain-containing protein [Nevskia soli]